MKIKSYEEMEIRKLWIELADKIYKITKTWWLEKDFGLRDQMRRSCVSISSNIAEGFERDNNNEFIRYLTIAKWSCWELKTQICIAHNAGFLQKNIAKELKEKCSNISKQIWGFLQYLKDQKEKGNFKKK